MTNEECIRMAGENSGFNISAMKMSQGDYLIQNDHPKEGLELLQKFVELLGAIAHPQTPQVVSIVSDRKALVVIIRLVVEPPHPNAN